MPLFCLYLYANARERKKSMKNPQSFALSCSVEGQQQGILVVFGLLNECTDCLCQGCYVFHARLWSAIKKKSHSFSNSCWKVHSGHQVQVIAHIWCWSWLRRRKSTRELCSFGIWTVYAHWEPDLIDITVVYWRLLLHEQILSCKRWHATDHECEPGRSGKLHVHCQDHPRRGQCHCTTHCTG